MQWLLRLWPWLTSRERKCCHMGQYGLDAQPLSRWRREFRQIDRSEHCQDCPLLDAQ
jgi:hypothetical protein